MNRADASSAPLTILELLAPGADPLAESSLCRGVIVGLATEGQLLVQLAAAESSPIACDFLETSAGPHPELGPGDLVLVLRPAAPTQAGVVLGRIGRYRAPGPQPAEHLVIEATEMLTLKCGPSEIDLRSDGKLLIRGDDVVSRATRTQRIKGGTVAIN
jgi:hypothetical protein